MLLFACAFLCVHYTLFQNDLWRLPTDYAVSFVILFTYGLVAIYIVALVMGMPTVFLLHRRSSLNLFSVNVAALFLTPLFFVGLRLMSLAYGVAEPPAAEIVNVVISTYLVAPFVLFSATLFCWIVTKDSTSQFGLNYLLMLVAIVAFALSVASTIRGCMEPRVVVSVDHPNGGRLLVTQEFGVISEPFVTEVFFDDGDGKWRWYYYDHEDSYWGSADHEISASKIVITTPGNRGIQLDTLTGECKISNKQGRTKTYDKSTRTDVRPPVLGVQTNK